jgi:hypothetical protein
VLAARGFEHVVGANDVVREDRSPRGINRGRASEVHNGIQPFECRLDRPKVGDVANVARKFRRAMREVRQLILVSKVTADNPADDALCAGDEDA